jgi:uncharacterized membrane protein YhaH (DUF805 family)
VRSISLAAETVFDANITSRMRPSECPDLNPSPVRHDTLLCTGFVGASACRDAMEELFEFLFGASGRINRAKYWRSLLVFIGAGLLVGVILFTAAGLAAPLFILMLVIVFIPWLLWGFAFHTERLHDRGKSAWWLVVFYAVPGMLGNGPKQHGLREPQERGCITPWRWQVLRSRSGDLSRSVACAAMPDPTDMAPIRSH